MGKIISAKSNHGKMSDPVIGDSSSLEIELKFNVPPERLDALKKKLRSGKVHVQRLQAIYFDTADERLALHGATIRLRKEGRKWVQTAKALTPDTLSRLEHNVDVMIPCGRRQPQLDLALHLGTPVGAAICAALDSASTSEESDPALIERFRVDVSRMVRIENMDGTCVELALDTGMIHAGKKAIPLCEFEMELKSGSVAELFGLATTWETAFGLWISTVSKAERGVRLLHDDLAGPPVIAVNPVIDPSDGEFGFLVATLECCLKQILGNASEVAAGALDEEIVHELRVGLRRMRTALRELTAFAPHVDPAWETVFSRAFKELGAHRDVVAVIPSILQEMSDAGVDYRCESRNLPEIQNPEDVVRDTEFQQTLLAVMAFCHTPLATNKHKKGIRKRLRVKIAKRLGRLHALLVRDAKRFSMLPPAHQHRVRKRLKRMRYLSEFAGPLFYVKRVKQYLANWSEAQDALGEYNDLRIGIKVIKTEEKNRRHAKPALHWLTSRLKTCVKRCARILRKAARNPVFWDT
jgi:triphosphatase